MRSIFILKIISVDTHLMKLVSLSFQLIFKFRINFLLIFFNTYQIDININFNLFHFFKAHIIIHHLCDLLYFYSCYLYYSGAKLICQGVFFKSGMLLTLSFYKVLSLFANSSIAKPNNT